MDPLIVSSKQVLSWRKKLLCQGGRSVDLDWLLDLGGGLTWTSLMQIHIDPSKTFVLNKSLEALEALWIKHLNENIPLQYLIGVCPWRDFELEVSPAVLIPRQETELVVDFALEIFNQDTNGIWVDLGTGSGAIAIGLEKSFPSWNGHAVDLSEEAIIIARKNLERLSPDVKCMTHIGDWWEPIKPWWGTFNLVIANPPYIPLKMIGKLDSIVRDNEPLMALSGGPDGLESFRDIISNSLNKFAPKGCFILEHHHDQSDMILHMLDEEGFKHITFKNDIEGVKRFAIGFNS